MSDAHYQRIFSLCVKKTSLLLFNILVAILCVSCSSHSYRAPVTSVGQPQSLKVNSHIVARGDTLYAIAWRYNLDYKNLAKINGVRPPYSILPGQEIRLKGVAVRQPYQARVAAAKPVKSAPVPIRRKPVSRIKKETYTPVVVKSQSVKSGPLVWAWPVDGRIVSPFRSGKGLNKGIDIAAKLGESVHAAADGEVVYAGSGLRGYGKLLIVKHQNSYLSAYAHNSQLLAKEGQGVKRGQKIAEVGASGTTTVKLHFEIRKDGVPVDPVRYLP
jgi:lipoprotein NlpD